MLKRKEQCVVSKQEQSLCLNTSNVLLPNKNNPLFLNKSDVLFLNKNNVLFLKKNSVLFSNKNNVLFLNMPSAQVPCSEGHCCKRRAKAGPKTLEPNVPQTTSEQAISARSPLFSETVHHPTLWCGDSFCGVIHPTKGLSPHTMDLYELHAHAWSQSVLGRVVKEAALKSDPDLSNADLTIYKISSEPQKPRGS